MREKLLDLMKNEGLRPSQLAEMLEINPAGISHILAGRNKPGFDLLQKILRRFPQINPDWLLLDSSKMYRDATDILSDRSAGAQTQSTAAAGNLFDNAPKTSPIGQIPTTSAGNHSSPDRSAITDFNISDMQTSGNRTSGKTAVAQVVIFYEDKTFESFTPKHG